MTIECYLVHCPSHSCNGSADEGPFCHEDECVRSAKERDEYYRKFLAAAKEAGINISKRGKYDET